VPNVPNVADSVPKKSGQQKDLKGHFGGYFGHLTSETRQIIAHFQG
jgi:hypothetical protein